MPRPPGTGDPAQPADHVLHWPAGFSPELSDVWARGELLINAGPAVVFPRLASVRRWEQDFSGLRNVRIPGTGRGYLEPDSEFEFQLNGLRLFAQVIEFLADSRLAWSGQGIDIIVYHAWVISGETGRSRVLTGFAARGAAAIALRESDPGAAQRTLDRWVADLKTAAENAWR